MHNRASRCAGNDDMTVAHAPQGIDYGQTEGIFNKRLKDKFTVVFDARCAVAHYPEILTLPGKKFFHPFALLARAGRKLNALFCHQLFDFCKQLSVIFALAVKKCAVKVSNNQFNQVSTSHKVSDQRSCGCRYSFVMRSAR